MQDSLDAAVVSSPRSSVSQIGIDGADAENIPFVLPGEGRDPWSRSIELFEPSHSLQTITGPVQWSHGPRPPPRSDSVSLAGISSDAKKKIDKPPEAVL
jgi:hypothetical protein